MDRQSTSTQSELKCMLSDEKTEPKALPLSLLKEITKDFTEEQEIGRGGFAVVYKGVLDNGAAIAVKRLSHTYMYEKQFHREVECLIKVKHKNVVRFIGYCVDSQGVAETYDGKFVMADVQQRLLCFEYLPHGTLDKYITDPSYGLDWRMRYRIINGICDGLHYLHQNQIVHLDLKPPNILLDGNMLPKIADFGLSRCFDEKQSRIVTSKIGGTMGYLAPEYGSREITYRFDLYSLGVIIMEILTGKKGHEDVENVLESWSNMLEKSHRNIQQEQVRVCTEIGIECIESNPAKRPVSMQHIIARLHETGNAKGSIETIMNRSSTLQARTDYRDPYQGVPNAPGKTSSEDGRIEDGSEMSLHGLVERLTGKNKEAWKEGRIRGTAVLVQPGVLAIGDFYASVLDGAHKILGKDGVAFHLVSATAPNPYNGKRGKVGKPAYLEEMVVNLKSRAAGESVFKVTFDYDASHGIPGALIVRNTYRSEFLLKKLTLEGVPGKGTVVFVPNSWIYPGADRVFFANDTYLPSKMPALLVQYRQEELNNLRGDSTVGEYKEHDRVYRYDYYNDLGEPDIGEDYARPILGGSQELPYPRRGRTGRPPTKKDPKSESRIPLVLVKKALEIYVPRDERIGHLRLSDFLGYSLKAITEGLLPIIRTYVDTTPKEFDSFQDIYNLYDGLLQVPHSPELEDIKKKIPFEFIKSILPVAGDDFLNLPLPQVIKSDKVAWMTDEEFAREMLAGVNPVCIKRVTEFPVKSTLDQSVYGDQDSKITEDQIQRNLEGFTVKQAIESKRLFILDHHDNFMPFLERINKLEGNYIYASRTLLFLKADGTLKPLAIELSLPHPHGIQHGAKSTVYPPANDGIAGQIWQLAKAYACVNDSAWHQLVSHWLNTHAVIEPFVIATNRQLSVVHPVHKLLSPHYRDSMNINALARTTVINAGGVFELTVFPGKYALEMSSVVYKNWKFTEQGLPDDLVKRGMAVPDPSSPYKVRLLIKDYPYAVDGLVIWWAIERWVKEYLEIYYPNDGVLRADKELEEWWKEVREVGHGDLKDRDWWPKMETVEELAKTCTTIIWVASALHAAVNFGQYPYAGYLPNRPTVSRRPMPVIDTEEYALLERGGVEAEKVFIHTITSQFQTILGITLIEILSKHSSDEVYLGQHDTPEWTSDAKALEAFKRFGTRLVEIEKRIMAMNEDPTLKNRNGPVKVPYMLLYPNTSDVTGEKGQGLSGMGIPNSVSI